ncbi:MAG: DUF695 domain-containing protein, partial [Muribaculaceae bacterium]|nr:DUF695 domain-containing protein [Muribaculaceae bacterium]
AVMTGIYTGDSRRDWVFYTKSLPLFQTYFNRALAGFEMLPLEFHAEHDSDWEEYRIMKENEVTGSD